MIQKDKLFPSIKMDKLIQKDLRRTSETIIHVSLTCGRTSETIIHVNLTCGREITSSRSSPLTK